MISSEPRCEKGTTVTREFDAAMGDRGEVAATSSSSIPAGERGEIANALGEVFPWPRSHVDPPAAYEWLRDQEPVRRVLLAGDQPGWLVTRYEHVRQILADPRASSDSRLPGFPRFGLPPLPADERSLLRMDPPDHTTFRRLLSRHFAVRRIEALRPRIQQLVDDTIDELLARPERSADLVQSFTLPIPSIVLSWILGVPAGDREFFNKASENMLNRFAGPEDLERSIEARQEIRDYITNLVEERSALADQPDDILGTLIDAERADVIARSDVINHGISLIVAGHESTANMGALGTLVLLEHPEQLAELRADPGLLPGAIEELLRYLTVVHLSVTRVASEDLELAGNVIPAGEAIIPLTLSANRDASKYDNPDQFDVRRAARDHLAFGFGIHQCVGQPLARVELQVIYGTLIRRIPTLRLAKPADDIAFKAFAPINGVFELLVEW